MSDGWARPAAADGTVDVGFVDLGAGSFVVHRPALLTVEERMRLRELLERSVSWEQRAIVLFGREVQQPRLISWYGTVPYRYSGKTLPARAWPRELEPLRAWASDLAGVPFNHVLLNRYRNGQDSMGAHADDEPELGEAPQIGSLTLGDSRRFVLTPRTDAGRALTLELGDGDWLLMGGRCQHTHRHAVPKTKTHRGERLNLTFRWLLRAPPRQD